MASRIAGITVVLDGDATKLSKALEGVNKEIKNTQSQLKDVDKLLKIDPSNTELLTQKQKYLGDALTETKTKLEALKNVKINNLGDLDDVQLDALNREIAETEEALKKLEQQGATTNKTLQEMSVIGTQMQNAGKQISSAGTSLLPVTAAVVAAGTAAVNTSQEFDTAMSQVAAVSGATGDDFTALRDKAIEMGAKTKFSASEAAEAMNYMAMAGWKTEDMLNGIEGVMNLAAASGENLGTTSDIVTDALTAFGLTAADSAHFADILAAASSNANTNVSMMGETFKYAAPVAGSLGYSAEDTAVAIGLMANSGIKASQAGTSLRTILLKLQGEIEISGEKLGEVSIQTANADGSMRNLSDILADCRSAFSQLSESEAAATAETLVGKNAVSGFLALMNASPADIEKLENAVATCSDEMNGFNGTCENMANTMLDNLGGDITILKSNLESLAISFGDLLIPIVREVVEHLQNIVTWLNSLDEGTKKTIVTVALIAAALGPVLIVLGKTITAVGTILTTIPKLVNWFKSIPSILSGAKTAFSGLFATLAAHPIVLIIAAIAALVAAFIYCWNNVAGFKEFWINLWETIKSAAVTAWEAIKSFLSTAWETIKSIATTVWTSIISFLSSVWEGIKSTATTVWNTLSTFFQTTWETIKTTATTVWETISTALKEKWTAIKESCVEIWGTLKDKISEIWDNIKSGVSEKITAIKETIVEGFNNAVDFIKGLAGEAFEWGANIIGKIIEGISSMIDKVKEVCHNIANKIREFLGLSTEEDTGAEQTGASYVEDMASGVTESTPLVQDAMATVSETMNVNPAEGVGDAVSAEWAAVSSSTTSTWGEIASYLQSTWAAISEQAQTIWTNLATFFTTCLTTIYTTFQTILTTLFAFLTVVWANVTTLTMTVWTNILTFLTTAWTTIYTICVQLHTQMFTAITTIWNNVLAAVTVTVNNMVNVIISGFQSAVSYIQSLIGQAYSWGSDLIGNIISGINSRIAELQSAIAKVASLMSSYLHFSVPDVGPLHDMKSWMPDMMKNLADGIEQNRGLVKDAVANVASDMAINPKIDIAGAIGNAISANSSMIHKGTIRVEGINDTGALSGVVDIIIDQLRREVRT